MTSIETLLFRRGIRSLKPGLLIYNEVRQHSEHRSACGALKTPDGDATQTDTRVMGVTREAPAAATGGLMEKLKAQAQEKGEDAFDKRLPIAKELKVRCFVSKVNRDGPVFAGPFGCGAHLLPLSYQVSGVDETRWR